MIILTGPDNTGKSTLASRLSEDTGVKVIDKFDGKPWEKPREWYRWLDHCCRKAERGEIFIADRLYYDDLVYGPLMRDGLTLLPHENTNITNRLIDIDAMVIVTSLEADEILKTFGDRDQYPPSSVVRALCEAYDSLIYQWPLINMRVVTYDYQRDSYDTVLRMVREYIEMKERMRDEHQRR